MFLKYVVHFGSENNTGNRSCGVSFLALNLTSRVHVCLGDTIFRKQRNKILHLYECIFFCCPPLPPPHTHTPDSEWKSTHP